MRNNFLSVLEREPCKGVMRRAPRVSDAWREKMTVWVCVYLITRSLIKALIRNCSDRLASTYDILSVKHIVYLICIIL